MDIDTFAVEREMAELLCSLALEARSRAKVAPPERVLVGLAGIPGAGKTTVARAAVARANQLLHLETRTPDDDDNDDGDGSGSGAACGVALLPMDGFHLSKAHLALMVDAAEAFRRRGAHWTFDCNGLLQMLSRLKDSGVIARRETIKAPGWSHEIGDPSVDAISIAPSDLVVVVEGNYLAFEHREWANVARQWSHLWFLECDIDTAMQRVVLRHERELRLTNEQAVARAEGNDRRNALEIIDNLSPAITRTWQQPPSA